ncbi:hypothetical protein [Spirillospora sp. CA-294931]|uniref:hypothetical protein n=1 Tax=Spirillospora sp. CA-294931 TaxID=3240042 RepID=UPI003D8CEC86
MRSLKAKAATLAGMAVAATVVGGVNAAPASAHVTSACARSTQAFIDTGSHPDRVGIRSSRCRHYSTIVCRNSAGARWTFTDRAATPSRAYNVNVCRSANPYLVAVQFHSH